MNKALFLDRDGVINIDHGYVCTPERFELVDGILPCMRFFQERDYLLVIVTNQAGIAKGHYTETQFLSFDQWMHQNLLAQGVKLTKTYYCPFHKAGSIPEFTQESNDRKPKPGMILRAFREFDIAANSSLLIGDKESDMAAAYNAHIPRRIHLGPDSRSPLSTEYYPTINHFTKYLDLNHE